MFFISIVPCPQTAHSRVISDLAFQLRQVLGYLAGILVQHVPLLLQLNERVFNR